MSIQIPNGYSLWGARVKPGEFTGYLVTPFTGAMPEAPTVWCIMLPGATGGWHYRNLWAAETALAAWDGKEPPMAGEWRDFE